MARRKTSRSRSRGCSLLLLFGLVLSGAYIVRFHWPWLQAYWLQVSSGLALIAFVYLWRLARRMRIASTLAEIDAMNGHEFERYLVQLFKGLGYRAENVGASGADFGADLIIEKDGVKIAVQAKNYLSGRVGNDAVQQAIAGATYYGCQAAMVVTNALYTKAAFDQADRCALLPVTLWNRNDLKKALRG